MHAAGAKRGRSPDGADRAGAAPRAASADVRLEGGGMDSDVESPARVRSAGWPGAAVSGSGGPPRAKTRYAGVGADVTSVVPGGAPLPPGMTAAPPATTSPAPLHTWLLSVRALSRPGAARHDTTGGGATLLCVAVVDVYTAYLLHLAVEATPADVGSIFGAARQQWAAPLSPRASPPPASNAAGGAWDSAMDGVGTPHSSGEGDGGVGAAPSSFTAPWAPAAPLSPPHLSAASVAHVTRIIHEALRGAQAAAVALGASLTNATAGASLPAAPAALLTGSAPLAALAQSAFRLPLPLDLYAGGGGGGGGGGGDGGEPPFVARLWADVFDVFWGPLGLGSSPPGGVGSGGSGGGGGGRAGASRRGGAGPTVGGWEVPHRPSSPWLGWRPGAAGSSEASGSGAADAAHAAAGAAGGEAPHPPTIITGGGAARGFPSVGRPLGAAFAPLRFRRASPTAVVTGGGDAGDATVGAGRGGDGSGSMLDDDAGGVDDDDDDAGGRNGDAAASRSSAVAAALGHPLPAGFAADPRRIWDSDGGGLGGGSGGGGPPGIARCSSGGSIIAGAFGGLALDTGRRGGDGSPSPPLRADGAAAHGGNGFNGGNGFHGGGPADPRAAAGPFAQVSGRPPAGAGGGSGYVPPPPTPTAQLPGWVAAASATTPSAVAIQRYAPATFAAGGGGGVTSPPAGPPVGPRSLAAFAAQWNVRGDVPAGCPAGSGGGGGGGLATVVASWGGSPRVRLLKWLDTR